MSNSSNSHTKIFRCVGVHVYRDFNNVFMCLWILQTAVGYGRFFRKKGQRLFIKTSFQILEFFRLSEIKKKCTKNWQVLFFLKNNSELYILLCFWTHTRTVQLVMLLWSHGDRRCTISHMQILFLSSCYAPAVHASSPPHTIVVISKHVRRLLHNQDPSLRLDLVPGGTDWPLMLVVTALCLGWFCQ